MDWDWASERDGFRPDPAYPVLYVLAYHSLGIGILGSLDQEDTNFSGPSIDNLRDAWSNGPKPDDDEWYFNYVAHPLWGSETYMRARSGGYDALSSFLFSSGASLLWEFGFESPFQRASTQDLLITSTTGSLLGEVRFRLKRHLLASDTRTGRVLAVVIDPLQSFTEQVGKVFGQDWSEAAYRRVASGDPVTGVRMDIGIIDDEPGLILSCATRF